MILGRPQVAPTCGANRSNDAMRRLCPRPAREAETDAELGARAASDERVLTYVEVEANRSNDAMRRLCPRPAREAEIVRD